MLILDRKTKQSFMIGDNGEITVTVLEIHRDRVKLGIEAPQEIPIDRAEVYLRKTMNRTASL